MWNSLGTVTVPVPGVKVRLTINQTTPADRLGCQAIMVQALSNGTHTNTGRVYLFDSTGHRLATLAVPTANSIPSASATIPTAPGALNANGFYVDADNANDGVDASFLR